jgi:hypothetical protein
MHNFLRILLEIRPIQADERPLVILVFNSGALSIDAIRSCTIFRMANREINATRRCQNQGFVILDI